MKQRNESELLQIAASFCSGAERCIWDVRQKLVAAGASSEVEERIVARLLQEKFIDEARYCRCFVNDKFRFNRWGRLKIGYELRKKDIPEHVLSEAIDQIDEDVYESALYALLKEKKRTTKGRTEQDMFNKLYRFAAGRGFEGSLTIRQLKKLFNSSFDVDVDT
jgi:regulatory protein